MERKQAAEAPVPLDLRSPRVLRSLCEIDIYAWQAWRFFPPHPRCP